MTEKERRQREGWEEMERERLKEWKHTDGTGIRKGEEHCDLEFYDRRSRQSHGGERERAGERGGEKGREREQGCIRKR